MDTIVNDSSLSLKRRMEKINDMIMSLKQDKFDLLLEFINKWLKLTGKDSLRELTKFRYISERDLIKNKKYNCNLVREYADKFKDVFGLNLSIDSTSPNNTIKKKYILHIIRKSLKYVNHVLRSKTIRGEIYYSICLIRY